MNPLPSSLVCPPDKLSARTCVSPPLPIRRTRLPRGMVATFVRLGRAQVALCDLRSASLRHAFRFGMTADDAEDCASDWVLHVLSRQHKSQEPGGAGGEDLTATKSRKSPEELLKGEPARRYVEVSTLHFVRERSQALVQRQRRELGLLTLDESTSGDSHRPNLVFAQGTQVERLSAAREMSTESIVLRQAQRESLHQELVKAIASLPPAQRAILVRHCVRDEPLSAIAGAVGITEVAAKQALYRARTTLRGRISQMADSN